MTAANARAGFTVIELLVVIGLVAIVAAVAAPGFTAFLDTQDAKNASMDLVADLTAARSEALKRNTTITVSPVAGNWTKGWQVKLGATVLRERSSMRSGLSMTAPGADVSFISSGRIADTELVTTDLFWTIASSRPGVQARCVVITPTGSARAKKGACA
jgi:type IV fimbrial biogenesis protein FimT